MSAALNWFKNAGRKRQPPRGLRLRIELFYSTATQKDGWDVARLLCALHESCVPRRATAPMDERGLVYKSGGKKDPFDAYGHGLETTC